MPSPFPAFRTWHILNLDSVQTKPPGEEVEGQFEAQGVTESITAEYAEHFTLNRQDTILQFLHGNSDEITFTARLFAADSTVSITEVLEKLKSWVRRDPVLLRPPVVLFWIGDGSLQIQAVITSLGGIQYDRPRADGSIRGVTMTITLKEFTPFTLEAIDIPESRFARAKQGDYMEALAEQEYGNALLGELVRRRHPALQILQIGNIVKLPSVESIRTEAVVPVSVPLKGSTLKKESPQKTLRETLFDRTNRTIFSLFIPEGA